MAKPITQAELDALAERCALISAELGEIGQRLQRDFMQPLDRVAQTLQHVTNASHALASVQSGLAIRLALREQERELRTRLGVGAKDAP